MTKLTLSYPLYPYYLNQAFGDNNACIENNSLPISQRKVISKPESTTCPVGYIELYPLLNMKGHTGADIMASHGQPLYHCGPDAFVEEIQTEVERGLGLGLITIDKYAFAGGEYQAKIRYWHLQNFTVKLGDKVKRGQLIGHTDNTGVSAGNHLHLECKPVVQDPRALPEIRFINVEQRNGYFGAIDPVQFFDGNYAAPLSIFFTRDMKYGEQSEDVRRLQGFLREHGFFNRIPTGYFGSITKEALGKFQLKYVSLSIYEKAFLLGKACGPKTRAVLNAMVT